MNLILERYYYGTRRTRGRLHAGNEVFQTLERPWIKTPLHLGGANFESCVPDGTYKLVPWDSEDHPNCYALINHDLDVHLYEPADGMGRWAILIHVGNYIKDIVGCIAPGLTGDETGDVWSSAKAMNRLRAHLGDESHTLVIRSKGANNGSTDN